MSYYDSVVAKTKTIRPTVRGYRTLLRILLCLQPVTHANRPRTRDYRLSRNGDKLNEPPLDASHEIAYKTDLGRIFFFAQWSSQNLNNIKYVTLYSTKYVHIAVVRDVHSIPVYTVRIHTCLFHRCKVCTTVSLFDIVRHKLTHDLHGAHIMYTNDEHVINVVVVVVIDVDVIVIVFSFLRQEYLIKYDFL